MTDEPDTAELIRCVRCGAATRPEGGGRVCTACSAGHPVIGGILRALPGAPLDHPEIRERTGESFGYEWAQFGGLRDQWRKNFLDYLQPLDEAWFDGKVVLDVGTGSGRHAFEADRLGARVVAVDLGDAISVARENLPDRVLCVQADAECLPFADETFDLVMSIGVLHHLPDTERALRAIAAKVRPGGRLHVYLYWWPPTDGTAGCCAGSRVCAA